MITITNTIESNSNDDEVQKLSEKLANASISENIRENLKVFLASKADLVDLLNSLEHPYSLKCKASPMYIAQLVLCHLEQGEGDIDEIRQHILAKYFEASNLVLLLSGMLLNGEIPNNEKQDLGNTAAEYAQFYIDSLKYLNNKTTQIADKWKVYSKAKAKLGLTTKTPRPRQHLQTIQHEQPHLSLVSNPFIELFTLSVQGANTYLSEDYQRDDEGRIIEGVKWITKNGKNFKKTVPLTEPIVWKIGTPLPDKATVEDKDLDDDDKTLIIPNSTVREICFLISVFHILTVDYDGEKRQLATFEMGLRNYAIVANQGKEPTRRQIDWYRQSITKAIENIAKLEIRKYKNGDFSTYEAFRIFDYRKLPTFHNDKIKIRMGSIIDIAFEQGFFIDFWSKNSLAMGDKDTNAFLINAYLTRLANTQTPRPRYQECVDDKTRRVSRKKVLEKQLKHFKASVTNILEHALYPYNKLNRHFSNEVKKPFLKDLEKLSIPQGNGKKASKHFNIITDYYFTLHGKRIEKEKLACMSEDDFLELTLNYSLDIQSDIYDLKNNKVKTLLESS